MTLIPIPETYSRYYGEFHTLYISHGHFAPWMRATALCIVFVGVIIFFGLYFALGTSPPSSQANPPKGLFSATTGSSVWWVGAESTDSSALPNTGVRGTIQVVSLSVTGCLAFWVADDLSNDVWGQVGYFICSGSTPTAFYQIWGLGNNTVLSGGSENVGTGSHVFSMSLQSGTTWVYSLDGTSMGTYNMGASSSSSSYPVEAMSEEQGSSVFSIPEVTFSPALQVLQSGVWSSVSTATSYGTSWGIEGNAQDAGLGADEIIVGGSLSSLSQGTTLWSSGSTTTSSSTTFPPTSTVTTTVTSTFDTTQTDTVTSTATTTVTQTTTSTSTATSTSTKTSTVTSTLTSTSTSTATSTSTTTTTLTKTDTSTTTSTASTTATSTSTVTSTATQTTTSTATSTATTTVTTSGSPTTTITVTTTASQTSTGTNPTTTVTITSPGPSTTTVTSTQTSIVTSPTTETTTVTRVTILTAPGPTVTTTLTDSGTKTETVTATVTSTQTVSATPSATSTSEAGQQQGSGSDGSASLIPSTPFVVLLIGAAVGVGGVLVGARRTLARSRDHGNSLRNDDEK